MAPADLLAALRADSLLVELDGVGIALDGPADVIDRWLPIIRDHKAVLIASLTDAIVTATVAHQPNAEKTLRGDFACLVPKMEVDAGDTVLDRFDSGVTRDDAEALACCDDDRRHCTQCVNLQQKICIIAAPKAGALVVGNKGYRPVPDLLLRCEGYIPKAGDPDQRPGRERWPANV